jgi:hypothetical protein
MTTLHGTRPRPNATRPSHLSSRTAWVGRLTPLRRFARTETSGQMAAAAAFATTEHFNLQTARAMTISESNGRASIYLAALSSNLIALAFIGQMSRLGVAFYAFALILLPVLAFVGVVTFVRLVQSSIEDLAYAHRIGLLRSYYLESGRSGPARSGCTSATTAGCAPHSGQTRSTGPRSSSPKRTARTPANHVPNQVTTLVRRPADRATVWS